MLYGVHARPDAFLDSLSVGVRVCRDLNSGAVRFLHPGNEFFGYVTVASAEGRRECRASAAGVRDAFACREQTRSNVLAGCEAVAQREDFIWAAKVTDGREARL